MNTRLLLALATIALPLAAAAPVRADAATAPTVQPAKRAEVSVVRVNSANQAYDFFRPWSKRNPFERHGLGAVLSGGRVLVTAELVANHNAIELEKAESGEKVSARVLCVDYESNLALLASADPAEGEKFFAGLKALEVGTESVVGDRLNVLQLESNDALVSTPGPITTIEVGRYQLEGQRFLLYRMSVPLQFREGSFTAPVIDKGGRLAGILMRYDPRSQTLDVVPGPVIAHFLKDNDAPSAGGYGGFPKAGFEFAPMRDPQLRRYAKLPAGSNEGVYITDVAKGGPAAAAGVRAGDVLVEAAGQAIDQDGNFAAPLYGRINVVHLFTSGFVGDRVPIKYMRDGQPQTAELVLARKPPQDFVSPPYVLDRGPKYLIADGMIFQELSRQYLKEWGGDWQKQAPQRLVYLDRYQSALVKDDRKRVVILSNVLPTASNIGYEDLTYLIVRAVNGRPLSNLGDLAKALEEPAPGGFHKIQFEDFPREIYLDAARLPEENAKIQRTYGLPILQRLD